MSSPKKLILDDVSFTIPAGKKTGIVGPPEEDGSGENLHWSRINVPGFTIPGNGYEFYLNGERIKRS